MLPPPLSQRSLARASRTVLLLGLATLCATPAASAFYYYGVGAGVIYSIDVDEYRIRASACIQHDSMWPNPVPVYPETDDEGVTVWVASGTDESAGSEKASTACITSGADLPGGNP